MIDRCRARQPMWAVNGLAVSALPDLLATVDLPAWSVRVPVLREQLVAVLSRHGLDARALGRQLGARRGAAAASPPGAPRDRGAGLHQLRHARAWSASPCPTHTGSNARRRPVRRSTTSAVDPPPRRPESSSSRKAHHDQVTSFSKPARPSGPVDSRCGVSGGRVPRPLDQAPGFARSASRRSASACAPSPAPVRRRCPSPSRWRCSPATTASSPKGSRRGPRR